MAPKPPPAPARIGRYEVREVLSWSDPGPVYRAFDPVTGRETALRLLPSFLFSSAAARESFETQATALRALDHPALVAIYDDGFHDGAPYLATQLLAGGSLFERLERGPLGLEETLAILRRVCAALDYAHEHGVIHAHIAPRNILFDQASNAYLADLGIVTLLQSASGHGPVGHPWYMAPEYLLQGAYSALVDVYAMGVIFFQMLAGQHPFPVEAGAGALRHMLAQLTNPVPDVLALRPDLPPGAQAIVERAMHKDPALRYQTAGEIAGDFARLVS
jgi:serine/threonine-protein kinase